MKRIQSTIAVLVLAAACSSGCKTIAVPSWTKSWFPAAEPKIDESKYPRPVRLAVVWSPAMLNTPGKKPTRGFGGRIYFYDAANKTVAVEGQLVVYGYDDSQHRAEGKTPDRKYAFTPEQFTEHFSETELGASYSVWIPWDEVGGQQVEVSLVPIFTATSGQLVVGQSSKNLLPGPTTENSPTKFEHLTMPPPLLSNQPERDGVQRAAFEQMVPHPIGQQDPVAFQETTVRVPSTLAEQLAKANPQTSVAQQLEAMRAQRIWTSNQQQAAKQPLPSTATASSARAPWGSPPPSSPTNQPSARFLRPAHPAPSSPGLQPTPGPLLTPPFPGAQPSGPPASPMPGPQSGYSAAW